MVRKKINFSIGEHINIGNFHGEILNIYKNGNHYLCRYKCDICGYVGENRRDHINNGVGCKCCANRIVVPGINDIPTTHPDFVKFFPGGYDEAVKYHSKSMSKIIPICPYCGRSYGKEIHIRNIILSGGIQCVCNDGISTPNKFIYALMEQLIGLGRIASFQREFQIEEDKTKFFDIYFILPNKKQYVVEMDGGFHPYKNTYPHTFKEAERMIGDLYKDELAEYYGYKLIRIDCRLGTLDSIKHNILNSELSGILDLSDINWEKIYEATCSNLVKEVCDYRKEHPELFPKELSRIFNISECTVCEYLKRGNLLGWCSYDPKEERERYYTIGCSRWTPIMVEIIQTKEKLNFPSINSAKKELHKRGFCFNHEKISNEIKKNGYLLDYYGLNIYKGDKV